MVNAIQRVDKAYNKLMKILNEIPINTGYIKKLLARLYEINRQYAVELKRFWYNRPTKYKDCIQYLKLFHKLIKEYNIIVNMKTFKNFAQHMYDRYNSSNSIILNLSLNEYTRNMNFYNNFYDTMEDLLFIHQDPHFLDDLLQQCSDLSKAEGLRFKKHVVNHRLPQNVKNRIYST